ncbi:MAG TPA: alpha/beta hydrolase, partial [Hyphomicrobium sp.]|nr:alpha/beta hydrolase [Hyphomicrobium sp.]
IARALATDPAAFAGVRCLVAPLLLSAGVALERMVDGVGLAGHADEADRRQKNITGISLSQESPVDWAASVTLPTLTYGVRDDSVTHSSDLEAIFAAICTDEKSMFWIDGTTSRWDGYTWFQRHPDRVLEWFEKHMQ